MITVIPDWETQTVCVADVIESQHPQVFRGLALILERAGIPIVKLGQTKTVWVRDYAPVQVDDDAFVQFEYKPDYLRGHRNLITPHHPFWVSGKGKCRKSRIILDGGNVVGTRQKAILTDKTFDENGRVSRPVLGNRLRALLKVEECIFIPKEPKDLFGHVDGTLRFLDDDTVLINDYAKVNRGYGHRLKSVLKSHGIAYEELAYVPVDRKTNGVPTAAGCYINFLQVGQLVVAPTFGIKADEKALKKLAMLLHRAQVVPLECKSVAEDGGLLHCITWNIRTNSPCALTHVGQTPSP